jgi:O-antigen/teichoic acid export membrane protein
MIGRSALAYVPVNLASVIYSFGGLAVLTRLFEPAEYGRYALAMITMLAVHMGLFTWLEAAMARFQARAEREEDVNSHLKTIYSYAVMTTLIGWSAAMLLLFVLPLEPALQTVLAFAISSTCFQLFLNLGTEAHKAAHRITRYSAVYSSHLLLSFVVGILVILATPLKESGPFVGLMVASFTLLLFDLPFMIKKMRGGKVQREKFNTYMRYGMPISISLLLTYTLASGDMYIITAMLGNAAAGEYSASYNFANRSLDILFVWLGMAATPLAVTAFEHEGLQKSKEIMHTYASVLLFISLPAATGMALVASDVGFILGEGVRDGAVKIMPLIAFAGVLNGMISYYAHRAFMLSGKTGMFVWAMVPPVILNIGLNIYLIPIFGLMGAVYATVAAYALGLVISIALGRRYYPLPLPVRACGEVLAACGVMAAIVLMLPIPDFVPDFISLVLKAMVGIVVYGAVSYAINAANCKDLAQELYAKYKGYKNQAQTKSIDASKTPPQGENFEPAPKGDPEIDNLELGAV